MEWSEHHVRVTIIGLLKAGHKVSKIYSLLKPLQINERFVYRTVQRFKETGDVVDRQRAGRPRSARTKNVVKAIRSRIDRCPLRKQKIIAREMNIAPRTVSRIIRDDLHLRAYKRSTGHLLTEKLKAIRYERSKKLKRLHGKSGYKNILFTDEKIFTIEEKFNKQNDRIYARSSNEAKQKVPVVQRGHHPSSIMVWWGVSWHGVTPIHFCETGVKTSAKVYENTVLEHVVKPLNNTLFNGVEWIFQQDSAPAHKAKSTQKWLQDNIPGFIAASDWPSGSPDLNPLDYELWDILEQMACRKSHKNLESLKKSIQQAAAKIPLETVRACIARWPERLSLCIANKGGHFE